MGEERSDSAARERIALLTERQRECLRLVYTGHNSKEIAQAFGISPHTVDDRLRSAIRTLGVTTRFQAARALAEAESTGPQPLMHQPGAIADDPFSSGDTRVGNDTRQSNPTSVREDHAQYRAYAPSFRWPLRKRGVERNDVNRWKLVGWIILIGAAIPVLLGSLLVGLLALGRIGSALTH